MKIFLDAPTSERVERRNRELERRGVNVDRSERRGTWRNGMIVIVLAPKLRVQAPDAIYVDSGGLSIEEVEEQVLKIVRERTANGKEYSREWSFSDEVWRHEHGIGRTNPECRTNMCRCTKSRSVAVVVSAMSKVTDLLLDTLRAAESGRSWR